MAVARLTAALDLQDTSSSAHPKEQNLPHR